MRINRTLSAGRLLAAAGALCCAALLAAEAPPAKAPDAADAPAAVPGDGPAAKPPGPPAAAPAEAPAAKPEDVRLAEVNGHAITRADVDRFMRVLGTGADRPGAVPEGYGDVEGLQRVQTLRTLIDRQLLLARAREAYGNDEAQRKALDSFAELELEKFRQRAGSKLKASEMLARWGLSAQQFKDLQVEQLLILKFIDDTIYKPIKVSPTEVRRYYEEHRDAMRAPRTVVYRQILFPVVSEEEQAAQEARAGAARDELAGGADFAEVADRTSTERAAAEPNDYPGGLHVVQVPDDQPDWLPPAVRGLEPGQLSDVRPSAGGYSVAVLERIDPARELSFEEVQGRIQEVILETKRADALNAYVDKLRSDAKIEYYPAARELGL